MMTSISSGHGEKLRRELARLARLGLFLTAGVLALRLGLGVLSGIRLVSARDRAQATGLKRVPDQGATESRSEALKKAQGYYRAALELVSPKPERFRPPCLERPIEGSPDCLAKVVEENQDVLHLVLQGAGLNASVDFAHLGHGPAETPRFQSARHLARILQAAAMQAGRAGDGARAVSLVRALVRFQDLLAEDHVLIGEMIRVAGIKAALQVASWLESEGLLGGEDRAKLREVLRPRQFQEGLLHALRGEMRGVLGHLAIDREVRPGSAVVPFEAPVGLRHLLGWLLRPVVEWQAALYIEGLSELYLRADQALQGKQVTWDYTPASYSILEEIALPKVDKAVARVVETREQMEALLQKLGDR